MDGAYGLLYAPTPVHTAYRGELTAFTSMVFAAPRRYKRDGLSNVQYRVVQCADRRAHHLFEHICIEQMKRL